VSTIINSTTADNHFSEFADPGTRTDTHTMAKQVDSADSPLSGQVMSTLTFKRKKLLPMKPVQSALTSRLRLASSAVNPFTENYATVSGRGVSASTLVRVYFPHANTPAKKCMVLNIRADCTIEELIGFALLTYWEGNTVISNSHPCLLLTYWQRDGFPD
jgi:hypothetical protein